MILGIMQPYFMPYLGYFSLIKQVDHFILFDTPQFIRHGWIERNKVLKLNGEPFYIKVPLVKHKRTEPIINININNSMAWQDKLFAQLTHYKKQAPFYKNTIELLKSILEYKTDSITKLNEFALFKINAYLGINTTITVCSEMDLDIPKTLEPDEYALHICKALGANSYINPIGGRTFFNTKKYTSAQVEIKFLEQLPTPYQQFTNKFVPFLSIVDVMMFNSRADINSMMDDIKFV